MGAGLQQGIEYAKILDIPYVFASNGDGFVFQNLITGDVKSHSLEGFPSPLELFQMYQRDKGSTPNQKKVMLEPYYWVPGYKKPRYYQRIAINRAVDAVAGGKDRVLLVCATGDCGIIVTGRTNPVKSRVCKA